MHLQIFTVLLVNKILGNLLGIPPLFFLFKSTYLIPYIFNISLLNSRYISSLSVGSNSFDVGVFKTSWILRRNCFS